MAQSKEAKLWTRYGRSRSLRDRTALFEHYWPWIKGFTAVRLNQNRQWSHIDDVLSFVSERVFGAIPRFDPSRKIKPRTYLIYHISGAIKDALRHCDHLHRRDRATMNRWEEFRAVLGHSMGHAPTTAEISEYSGITESSIMGIPGEIFHWESPQVSRTGESVSDCCRVPADMKSSHECIPMTSPDGTPNEEFRHVTRNLSTLARNAVWLYFFAGYNMKETGAALGRAESRISQILAQAKTLLRNTRSAADFLTDI